MTKILLIPIIAMTILLCFSVQDAHAIDYDISTDPGCNQFGGSLVATTCTIQTVTTTVSPGNSLTIPSGATLVMTSNGASYSIYNVGTINNSGTMVLSNTSGYSIYNVGTINNNPGGLITISASNGVGIVNPSPGGTINNKGIITIAVSGNSNGISISVDGIINNSGTITISNTDGIAILNVGTINNTGLINNSGTINNYGTIKIWKGGSITNSGTIFNCNNGVTPSKITGKITGNKPTAGTCP